MTAKKCPYQILGVDRSADAAAIKAAYRRLSKKFHPDKNPGDAAAADAFRDVNAANTILTDTEKRKRYDETGDMDGADRYRREIETAVCNLFGEAIKTSVEGDVLGTMRRIINLHISTAHQHIADLNRAERELKRAQEKLKVKDPRGAYLQQALAVQLSLIALEREKVERAIRFHAEVILELEMFEYQATPKVSTGSAAADRILYATYITT